MPDQSPANEQPARGREPDAQHANYRSFVENSQDLLYRTDIEGRITFISPSVQRLSGYTVEEAIGMRMAEEVYLVPEERQAFLEQLARDGRVADFEARLVRKDGSVWWASTNAHFYRGANGEVLGVEGITRDITKRRNADEKLRSAEERFRLAFHTSPDAINLNRLDDGLYIDINQGFTDIMGYAPEEVIGRSSVEISIWADPADRQRLVDGLRDTGFVHNLEARFVRKDGTVAVGLMSARVLRINDEDAILSVTRDITERMRTDNEKSRLQEQLARAQRLEAVGRLAGGVAHDLNNQLAPILGYAELLLDVHPEGDRDRDSVEQIIKASKGARDLVRQLLAIGRRQTLDYQPLNLDVTLAELTSLLRRTIREDIRLDIVRNEGLGPVMADRGQIEQVIMNLAANASEAMPDGGTLRISTAPAESAAETITFGEEWDPARYIMLSVSDTGLGMDEETRSHVFEPFFTTKGDPGTGLGLASVYGIVKQHEGEVAISSSPGYGTTCTIYLPIAETKTAHAAAGRTRPDGRTKESGTILLVEDNPDVRMVVERILSRRGYSVVATEGAAQAIELVESGKQPVDLLLTDVIMPDMNGRQLFDRLARIDPSLKVIFMSGYATDSIVHHGILEDGMKFIQKPFSSTAIVDLAREVLEGES